MYIRRPATFAAVTKDKGACLRLTHKGNKQYAEIRRAKRWPSAMSQGFDRCRGSGDPRHP